MGRRAIGSGPDRTGDQEGGIAARLHDADGRPIAGEVFLLIGSGGSTAPARVYDTTPYVHDHEVHPDTVASNRIANRTVRTLTGTPVDLVEMTNSAAGGPSGGVTRAIAYLDIVSDGAFTGDLRVAATGRMRPGGHLGAIEDIDSKTVAADLADVDVLFTPTVPSVEATTRPMEHASSASWSATPTRATCSTTRTGSSCSTSGVPIGPPAWTSSTSAT